MEIEALAVRLRPRRSMEAADLGVRLCQSAARSVCSCYAIALLPVSALALAAFGIAHWLPLLVLWWSKPWLDRTIVFVLSRAAFGQATMPGDLWRARRQVWWSQLALTWTLRRLSPWRSFTQPVYQLEGLAGKERRVRLQPFRRKRGQAALVTSVFSLAETALTIALLSLIYWLAPTAESSGIRVFLTGANAVPMDLALVLAYAAAIGFLEPFYAAAGFAMYLNRRVELEAWDIEQEFRRAFAR